MKWIMRYLRTISKMRLCFGSGKPELIRGTDANMTRDIDSKSLLLVV